jgi:endonuclease/exonuclease/phosphatase (EEP) superfamily protein YafD
VTDTETLPQAPARARPAHPRRWTFLVVLALCLLPWAWYLVRGVAELQVVAAGLPVISAVGALLAAVIAVARRRVGMVLVALSFVAFGVFSTIAPRMALGGPLPMAPLRIVSANIYQNNTTPQAALDALLAQHADVTIAVETPIGFQDALAQDPRVPANRAAVGQLVVVSTYPLHLHTTPASLPEQRVMVVTVDTPNGPLTLFVVHSLNPSYETTFIRQLGFVRRLKKAALRLEAPTLLIGDFNLMDRGEGYREMTASFRDAMRTDGLAASTYIHGLWKALFLRIDHAFLSPQWCAADATSFAVPGSDHLGIATSVGPCAT